MKKFLQVILLLFITNYVAFSQQIDGLSNKYEKLAPSVFKIYTFLNNGSDAPCGLGSGCIISSDGTCITNYHVLEGKKRAIAVLPSGQEYEIKIIIDYNEKSDLIKFKIGDLGEKFPACPISYIRPKIGESTFAIGYPQGFVLEGESTLSTGIISGYRTYDNMPYIQTTTPITHGSSGGGLFNSQGQLCGITSGAFISSTEDLHANLNMAVPTSEIQKLKRSLNKSLGGFFEDVSETSFYAQAMINYENEDYENAIRNFMKHLEVYPNDGFTWYRIAQCGYNIFKLQYATGGLGLGMVSKENIELTEKALLQAITLDENNHYAYAQLAMLYMYLDNAMHNTTIATTGRKTLYEHREEIKMCVNACMAIAPKSKMTQYVVATYNMDVNLGNNYKKAIDGYESIIASIKDSENIDDRNLMVDCYIGLAITKYTNFIGKDKQMAIEECDKALSINPESTEANFSKFAFQVSEGLYSDACKTYNWLYKNNPNAKYGGMELAKWKIFICDAPPTIEFFTKDTDAKFIIAYKNEVLGYVDISHPLIISIKMQDASKYDNYDVYKKTKKGDMKHFWSVRTTAYNKVNISKSNVTTKVSVSQELINAFTN